MNNLIRGSRNVFNRLPLMISRSSSGSSNESTNQTKPNESVLFHEFTSSYFDVFVFSLVFPRKVKRVHTHKLVWQLFYALERFIFTRIINEVRKWLKLPLQIKKLRTKNLS